MFASVGPYGVQLYFNDFLSFPYSSWQATNWVWTLSSILDGDDCSALVQVIGMVGVFGVCGILVMNSALVRPRRTATPERVRQELEQAKRGQG